MRRSPWSRRAGATPPSSLRLHVRGRVCTFQLLSPTPSVRCCAALIRSISSRSPVVGRNMHVMCVSCRHCLHRYTDTAGGWPDAMDAQAPAMPAQQHAIPSFLGAPPLVSPSRDLPLCPSRFARVDKSGFIIEPVANLAGSSDVIQGVSFCAFHRDPHYPLSIRRCSFSPYPQPTPSKWAGRSSHICLSG